MKARRLNVQFALGLILAANISNALAGDNDPFGPEMSCFHALRHFGYARKSRAQGFPSSGMQPISISNDTKTPTPPDVLGLEEQSPDGMSLILHFFTASGEFDTTLPYPQARTYETRIGGISYSGGTGGVAYSSVRRLEERTRLGSMEVSGSDADFKGKTDLAAHQVGSNLQAQSAALLDGEIAIMIQSVFNNFAKTTHNALGATSGYLKALKLPKDPPDAESKILSPDANKEALNSCATALKDPEFKSLQTLVTQEIAKFDSQPAPGGFVQDNRPQRGTGASNVVAPQ